MPHVAITHRNMTSAEAAAAPVRRAVEPGNYEAAIVAVSLGTTRGASRLMKMTVSYQILRRVDADEKTAYSEQGRRVFQDYILQEDASQPDISELRRWDLRQLLDATGVPFNDDGFNTDDFITEPFKRVVITIKHRYGKEPDESGERPVYTNVSKVDANLDLDSEMAAGDII
jgi:hypothetical protein